MKVYVLDSSAFFASFFEEGALLITIDDVVDEVRDRASLMHLDILRDKGLRVEPVIASYVRSVTDAARKTHDIDKLSGTDIRILAKAQEQGPDAILVTDDYAIQNLASFIGVKVRPLLQKKIRSVYVGTRKCTGCGSKAGSDEICPVCGSPTRRVKQSRKGAK